MNAPTHVLRALVHVYRVLVSPLLPPSCRFTPTCSEYALTALATHGALRGSWLAARRVLRCNPWGGPGHDPVPDAVGRELQAHGGHPHWSATLSWRRAKGAPIKSNARLASAWRHEPPIAL